MKIKYLKAFKDNYIWLIEHDQKLIVIDPGQSPQVINYITANNMSLQAILLTHGHHDHIDGVADIIAKYDVPVYGANNVANYKVEDNQELVFNDLKCRVIATPGHTFDGVSYLFSNNNFLYLFCGDTLFAAGCGRVFTNDYELMFNSLLKIINIGSMIDNNLANFLIYPGHEYTIKNLEFARYIEPNNKDIRQRLLNEIKKLAELGNTLPTNLKIELTTNPFLRINDKNIILFLEHLLKKKVISGIDCFINLRTLKDKF